MYPRFTLKLSNSCNKDAVEKYNKLVLENNEIYRRNKGKGQLVPTRDREIYQNNTNQLGVLRQHLSDEYWNNVTVNLKPPPLTN
jgi:hypothetical protein